MGIVTRTNVSSEISAEMIQLSGTIEGSKELSRRFMQIPDDLGNLKPPLFKIGREVRISVDANFSSRGALFGEKWEPRKDNKSHPLLEKTGRMRRAFSQRLGPDYVEIANPTEYFKYHQSNAPRRKLPRRVMLKIDEIRRIFIVKEFQSHIRQALKKGS